MFLIFQPSRTAITFGVFTTDGEIVYQDVCPIRDWSARALQDLFQSTILTKLRAHGKVFTKVGLIVPFASAHASSPTLADVRFLRQEMNSPFTKALLASCELLLNASQKNWPHLPHVFLFDTNLSPFIERHMVLPSLQHDRIKSYKIVPRLLHSYGHKANLESINRRSAFISLYIGEATSIALFHSGEMAGCIPAYSPISSLPGLYQGLELDAVALLDISEKHRLSDIVTTITQHTGLFPMIEQSYDLESLLTISGLVPRTKDSTVPDLSIESIEWIELSLRTFVRSIRHAIAALIADDIEARTLVVNSPYISEQSQFWKLLLSGGLSHLKIIHASQTLLQAAALDLAGFESSR